MCGISGFNWEDKDLVRRMIKVLNHRGPDSNGLFVDRGVSFGHNRLSIIDLSSDGAQPMCNEEGDIWITFNGEIYNYLEIRSELVNLGHVFKSNTDTEVIVHGYEQWGVDVLSKLNGMFAFAIFDGRDKSLFLARDRLGIKPLHYYFSSGKFIFASEIKAILECSEVERKVDLVSKNHYFTYGYTPTSRTMFDGIFKLEPGCFLVLKNDKLVCKKYWDFKYPAKATKFGFKKLRSRIREELDLSVKRRMVSDVGVGAFLSGGVDSSAIVASATKYKKDLKTFSIGFDYKEFNEAKYAKIVADKFGTDHYEKYFGAKDVLGLIDDLAYFYDDPLADYSVLPTYFVSKLARSHVTVCLGGDGGDESFGGYNWYWQNLVMRKQKVLPLALRRGVVKPVANLVSSKVNSHFLKKVSSFIEGERLSDSQRYARLRSFLSVNDLKKFGIDKGVFNVFDKYFVNKSVKNNMMESDLKYYMPGEILTKVDRASMAVSLEVRVPFLDHEFIEFTSKINSNLKVKGLETKSILKKSLLGVLPKEILYRKKRGFGVPLKQYFRSGLKDYVSSELDGFKMDSMIRDHVSKKKDYSHVMWSMLMYKKWKARWID
jgi:asparagine synthase (glutamine-hydrolysing)